MAVAAIIRAIKSLLKSSVWLRLIVIMSSLWGESCSRVVLDERFHNPGLTNWTIVDEPDTAEGPSDWRVEPDGWLHQRSNIWGRRGDFIGRWYGTLLVAGNTDWRDYTLSVKAKPEDDDGFGVVFRYSDPSHFYRLLLIEGDMNGGPLTRLDKRMGDDYTGLWLSERGYEPGRELLIVIDVKGNNITAMLNGTILATVVDDSYATGKVGLFCFAQKGQAFDDVRVTLK
ncbi:MAG TPA: hypothetical protein VFV34_21660 [Blastocatellia bacterium]|nr:hypothetical protein [Blastocatellia bacterium]